jgi:hypothetical protein
VSRWRRFIIIWGRVQHALATKANLGVTLAGLEFANPLGLAAGFDKNAACFNGAMQLGFGHVEVGTITPLPQPGNPKTARFSPAKTSCGDQPLRALTALVWMRRREICKKWRRHEPVFWGSMLVPIKPAKRQLMIIAAQWRI